MRTELPDQDEYEIRVFDEKHNQRLVAAIELVSKPLPTLPLWLADNYSIPLALEDSYEETCMALRIV